MKKIVIFFLNSLNKNKAEEKYIEGKKIFDKALERLKEKSKEFLNEMEKAYNLVDTGKKIM